MSGTNTRLAALLDTVEEIATVDLGGVGAPAPKIERSGERYVAGRTVGQGAFGEVVEAFDNDLRRRVAVKRLRDPSVDRHALRLVEEAQITAQLDHPSVPAVHSLGVDKQGRAYFAMDFIDGASLGEILDSFASDATTRAHWHDRRLLGACVQVGYALAFAHERGVLHRDIKPENVMIGRLGQVRLMDWGIAKVLHMPGREARLTSPEEGSLGSGSIETTPERDGTQAGSILGTPGYMAPEQAEGRPDIDARADLWSLGALLFTVLAGRGPVVADTARGVLLKTVAGELDPLRSLRPELDGALIAIVDKALAREPSDRYASVLELVREVEAYLAGMPVAAYDEGLLDRFDRFYLRRHPGTAMLRFIHIDTVGLGSLLVGIALGSWGPEHFAPFGWLLILVGVVLWVPFMWAWIRKARSEEDPDE
jgi:eukaryotic-like serine/threonine-protein kinase